MSLLLASIGPRAATAAVAFCDAAELPAFRFGFLNLSNVLRDTMGTPVECEHANNDNGDTLQATTTGLAVYRQSSNVATFTDGANHWALTDTGMVTWTGDSIDPPGVAPPPVLVVPTSTLPMPGPELPPASPAGGVWESVFVHDTSTNVAAAPQYPADNRLFRVIRETAPPFRNAMQVSATQGRTWDQLSEVACPPPYSLMLSPEFEQDATLIVTGSNAPRPCAVSHDGGRSWSALPPRIASSYNSATITFSPTFAQDQRLWLRGVIGGHSSVETSSDGGRTWTGLTFPVATSTLQDLVATGSATGRTLLLLGMNDGTRTPSGRYFRSTDLGVTWQEITEAFRDPTTLGLPSLRFQAGVDPDRVYAASTERGGGSWYSDSGGATWRKVSDRSVEAVTANGCGVLLDATGLELSCNGAAIVVAPAPPDTSPNVLSVASFVDGGVILVGGQHGLWTYALRNS